MPRDWLRVEPMSTSWCSLGRKSYWQDGGLEKPPPGPDYTGALWHYARGPLPWSSHYNYDNNKFIGKQQKKENIRRSSDLQERRTLTWHRERMYKIVVRILKWNVRIKLKRQKVMIKSGRKITRRMIRLLVKCCITWIQKFLCHASRVKLLFRN